MEEYKTILKKTDGGLDIFSYYLGKECLKKKFKSPFRSGDNRPSCHLYLNEPPGEQAYYYLQDFGDSRCSGNAFAIAARVLNMSIRNDFKAVLERIDQDLCLGVFEENKESTPQSPSSTELPSSKKSARTRHQVSRLSCLSYKNLCLGN
mgnify:CR=1 FL=1